MPSAWSESVQLAYLVLNVGLRREVVISRCANPQGA